MAAKTRLIVISTKHKAKSSTWVRQSQASGIELGSDLGKWKIVVIISIIIWNLNYNFYSISELTIDDTYRPFAYNCLGRMSQFRFAQEL